MKENKDKREILPVGTLKNIDPLTLPGTRWDANLKKMVNKSVVTPGNWLRSLGYPIGNKVQADAPPGIGPRRAGTIETHLRHHLYLHYTSLTLAQLRKVLAEPQSVCPAGAGCLPSISLVPIYAAIDAPVREELVS